MCFRRHYVCIAGVYTTHTLHFTFYHVWLWTDKCKMKRRNEENHIISLHMLLYPQTLTTNCNISELLKICFTPWCYHLLNLVSSLWNKRYQNIMKSLYLLFVIPFELWLSKDLYTHCFHFFKRENNVSLKSVLFSIKKITTGDQKKTKSIVDNVQL